MLLGPGTKRPFLRWSSYVVAGAMTRAMVYEIRAARSPTGDHLPTGLASSRKPRPLPIAHRPRGSPRHSPNILRLGRSAYYGTPYAHPSFTVSGPGRFLLLCDLEREKENSYCCFGPTLSRYGADDWLPSVRYF